MITLGHRKMESKYTTYGWRSLTFFCALLGLPSSSELFTFDLVLAVFFSFCLESPESYTQNLALAALTVLSTKKKNPICKYHGQHTFLPLTGGGIIVCALNLLFLQVSLKPSQICVKTSDVFVDLQRTQLQQTDFGKYFMYIQHSGCYWFP